MRVCWRGWRDAPQGKCEEEAQDVLDSKRTGGLVRGAGTGGTGVGTRTSGQVREAGTGRTGLWRRTGDLERRADSMHPGWMPILARQMRGAGIEHTGL